MAAVGAHAASPASGRAEISGLIGQLGKSTGEDAATIKKLRPLIARHRLAGPDRASLAGMPEDAWAGRLETLWIDRHDGRGNMLAGPGQRMLHSGGDVLRVYSLQGELETVGDGIAVIITGYRIDNRVLVTGVSLPPAGSLP